MSIRDSLVPLLAGMLALASVNLGAQAAGGAGFAVLELFTSEGCSSCPPADEALSDISLKARSEGIPVFALEWHVDYWDYLGWKDPLASRAATERQYAYARALPSSVYTPQLVANGSLVPSSASNRREIDRLVRSLTSQPPSGDLHVKVLSTEPGSSPASGAFLRVRVDVSEARAGTNLLLALVEAGLGSTPTAGENTGRRLIHSNVVRSFRVLPGASVETRFAVPPGVDLARSAVVGILQDARTMRIIGADQAVVGAHEAARLTGKVVDVTGRAVPRATVQACSDTVCVPAVTDASGIFVFEHLAPGSWSLAFDPKSVMRQVFLAAGQDVSLGRPLVLAH